MKLTNNILRCVRLSRLAQNTDGKNIGRDHTKLICIYSITVYGAIALSVWWDFTLQSFKSLTPSFFLNDIIFSVYSDRKYLWLFGCALWLLISVWCTRGKEFIQTLLSAGEKNVVPVSRYGNKENIDWQMQRPKERFRKAVLQRTQCIQKWASKAMPSLSCNNQFSLLCFLASVHLFSN